MTPAASITKLKMLNSIIFLIFQTGQVLCCSIVGPSNLTHFVGDDAVFRFNNTCGKEILSATWGMNKDNIADPQFIHVEIVSDKVHFNRDMNQKYVGRVDFVGNLRVGQAWFVLKNLTLDDNHDYIANIDDTSINVRLKVIERDQAMTTTEQMPSPSGISSTVSSTSMTTISDQGSNVGEIIVGPVIGVFLVLVVVVFVFWKKRKEKGNEGNETKENNEMD